MQNWLNFADVQTYNSWIIALMVLGIIISILGFGFLWVGLRQNTNLQRAHIFLEYTKRYHEICGIHFHTISTFPHTPKPNDDEIQTYLQFLPALSSIVQQEYFHFRQGLISKDLWELWQAYLIDDIKTKEFWKFWQTERNKNLHDPLFVKMIDKLISVHGNTNDH